MQLAVEDVISAWVTGLRFTHLPDAVVRQAKRSLIDGAGVISAGVSVPIVSELCNAGFGSSHSPERGRVPSLESAGLISAAFLGGTAAHALDFDDYTYDGIVHPGAVIAPATWAVARAIEADGELMLIAYIAGSEVAMALGRAFTNTMYFQHGWWNTATLGVIGAAISVGVLLRLGPQELANAICLSVFWAFGPRAVVGTVGKALSAGWAAEVGVRASVLASTGFERIGAAIEGPFGMATVFNGDTFNRDVIENLGKPFRLENFDNLTFKWYPCCSLSQTSIEATEVLMETTGLVPGALEAIREVQCEVPLYAGQCLVHQEARTVHEALFCLPYQVGCVLAYGSYDVNCLDTAQISDPLRNKAARKVRMQVVDPLPIALEGLQESARVSFHFADGRSESMVIEKPRGSSGRLLSDNDIEQKFRHCLKAAGTGKVAEQVLEILWGMESCRDAFRVPDLLMWPWLAETSTSTSESSLPSDTARERPV